MADLSFLARSSSTVASEGVWCSRYLQTLLLSLGRSYSLVHVLYQTLYSGFLELMYMIDSLSVIASGIGYGFRGFLVSRCAACLARW